MYIIYHIYYKKKKEDRGREKKQRSECKRRATYELVREGRRRRKDEDEKENFFRHTQKKKKWKTELGRFRFGVYTLSLACIYSYYITLTHALVYCIVWKYDQTVNLRQLSWARWSWQVTEMPSQLYRFTWGAHSPISFLPLPRWGDILILLIIYLAYICILQVASRLVMIQISCVKFLAF